MDSNPSFIILKQGGQFWMQMEAGSYSAVPVSCLIVTFCPNREEILSRLICR